MKIHPVWIVLLGPPASGKGSIGSALASRLSETGNACESFCVSDLLKENSVAKQLMDAGKLVPDDLVIWVVREKLDSLAESLKEKILFLDGAGRTRAQYQDLQVAAKEFGVKLVPVFVDTRLEVCFERALKRVGEDGKVRNDDQAHVVEVRFKDYAEKTEPVITELQSSHSSMLIQVDGEVPGKNKEEAISFNAGEVLDSLIFFSESWALIPESQTT